MFTSGFPCLILSPRAKAIVCIKGIVKFQHMKTHLMNLFFKMMKEININIICLCLSYLTVRLALSSNIVVHFIFIHYLYSYTLAKNPCPRCIEIYNFGRTFLVQHNYILSSSNLCLIVKRRFFLMKYINFSLVYPKIMSLWDEGSHKIYNFYLLTLQVLYMVPNLVKIGPVVVEKMLTDTA